MKYANSNAMTSSRTVSAPIFHAGGFQVLSVPRSPCAGCRQRTCAKRSLPDLQAYRTSHASRFMNLAGGLLSDKRIRANFRMKRTDVPGALLPLECLTAYPSPCLGSGGARRGRGLHEARTQSARSGSVALLRTTFPVLHGPPSRASGEIASSPYRSCVERTCVDDRLTFALRNEGNEEVVYHRSFSLLIQLHYP